MRIRHFGFVALIAAGLALTLAVAGRGADNDKGIVASLLSRVLSTPTTRVSIGSVSGALSSDVTISDIAIADRDGVWLKVDKLHLIWTRSALLLGRLEVDTLEIGAVSILRRPLPAEAGAPVSDAPILPEVPLKVVVQKFGLGKLDLGEAVVGEAASLTASGTASLGNASEGLKLRFDARRLDADGTLTARLDLVPQTQRLDLKLDVDEPAGGIVAHALNVPGQPPVKLDLNGSGTLDDFNARLAFTAGDAASANGTARLQREDKKRRLNLDLAARIEGLLPVMAAPVFAGTTRLTGIIDFADNSAIVIAPLSVASQTARLDIEGTLSTDQIADLKISARALPNAGGKTAAKGTEIGKLVFDATVAGPIMGPKIDAALDAQNVVTPQGKVAAVSAKFTASPSGGVLEDTTSIPFNAAAQADGIALKDPALARAIGRSLSLTLAGRARNGVADVETAHLKTATADVRFAGRIGGSVLQGRLAADVPELARFGGVASLDLSGKLGITADLTGVPNEGRFEAAVDGRATQFATGLAALDGLFGGRLNLTGKISKLANGGYGFGDLRLDGAHVSARLDGEATSERAEIDAHVSLPDLKRADRRLSGRAELTAKLTGTLDRPNGRANITVTDAHALGRPIPHLALGAVATDLTGLVDARVTLAGAVDKKPAQGALHLAKQPDGGWRLDDLDAQVGSVAMHGGMTVTADHLAEGRVTVDAGDLDDLSPLVLTTLSGQLHADATLAVADGGQNGSLSARAQGVKIGQTALDRLAAQAQLTDVYRHPVVDADIAIDRALIGGESISRIRLLAKSAARTSTITLTAQARGFALAAGGRLVAEDRIRLELSKLTAERDKRRLALTQPATITLLDDGVHVRSLTLALDRGHLTVDGRAGATLDLAVAAKSVPLSIVDVLVPHLGVSGTLDGTAKIAGTAQAPTGTWRMRVDRLVVPQTRNAGLPPVDIEASGRLADSRSTLTATIAAKGAGSIEIRGAVPLQADGDIDLRAKGQVDLGVANQMLSEAGRHVSGRAALDFHVTGNLMQPAVNGAATLAGADYRDALLGIHYSDIVGRIVARGTDIRLERLTAKTANGGMITAQGRVGVEPAAGFPGDIKISARRAQLIENDIINAVANLSLSLSGPLMRSPTVSGNIDVVSLDVTVPERLPTTLSPIEGTVHVAPPPAAAARLAAEQRARARTGRSPPFDATLDLTISAPNRVFVRGRGIDAELGGHLRVRGRLSDPETIGAFELRRGRFSIAGTRLDFTRGRIEFTGNLTPTLDFEAQTRAEDVTAIIAISGPARQPSFAFTSQPELPQDEVLSRLLFSKASGGLSPIQMLQLAQVAAQFSGAGGNDVFERVRKSLGVDSLDVSVGSTGNPTVGVSRAINRRISVGVKTGTEPSDSGASVDIDVTHNLRLRGEADANGGTAVGVGMEWEY